MYLRKLYSEPLGLFRTGKPETPHTIVFKDGFNFIYAKKDNQSDSKESLNGLGKSSVCDLIDFCLLSDFKKNTRLSKEKELLKKYAIVLEFEINEKVYIIKREIDKEKIEFGLLGEERYYTREELKDTFFDTIFDNHNYIGIKPKSQFRSLMSFFIKIHKKNNLKELYSNPIMFLTEHNTLIELYPLHIFLLGFDNTLFVENYDLQNKIKDNKKTISELKRIIRDNHEFDFDSIGTQISKLNNEKNKLQIIIDNFQLAEQHLNLENRLNDLTKEIKLYSEQNFRNRKKVESYKESYELTDNLSDSKIRNIELLFTELNQMFKYKITKTLKEAVNLRKQISKSRENFIREEILKLNQKIKENSEKIKNLDKERQNLFFYLDSEKAIEDLSNTYLQLGKIDKEISELEGTVSIYKNMLMEQNKYKAKDTQLNSDIANYISSLSNEIKEFETLFSDVYQAIYPQSESSGFSITSNIDKEKLKIDISFDKEESKGWNKGRTLVYDIAIMINSIRKKINSPKFLIHDGIFDGMDKSHFVALYHYIERLQEQGTRFQYIVTMIEEGELSESFGDIDGLSVDKIAEQAIVVLSKSQPLWVKE